MPEVMNGDVKKPSVENLRKYCLRPDEKMLSDAKLALVFQKELKREPSSFTLIAACKVFSKNAFNQSLSENTLTEQFIACKLGLWQLPGSTQFVSKDVAEKQLASETIEQGLRARFDRFM